MIGAFLLAATVVVQTPGSGSAPPADPVAEAYLLFIQGRTLEGRDDFAGAAAAYRKAIALLPDAAELHAELGALLARQGRAAEAIAEASAAVKIEPANREANRTLGLVQSQLADTTAAGPRRDGYVREAIDHLAKALTDRIVDPGAQFSLGRLYLQAGQYDQGIETLKIFLLDQPDYPDAMLLVATAYELTNRRPDAIATLKDLVAADPTQIRAWSALAELNEAVNDWPAAAAAWTEVAKRNPRDTDARTGRARALVNGGDLAAGREALVDAARSEPRDVNVWLLLSQVERRVGNPAGAEEAARHIEEIDPADPRGPLAIADTRSARGDVRGAIDALSPLAAKQPAASVLQDRLGDLYFQLKLYREAVEAWDRALSGDRVDIDVPGVQRKRDRARELIR